MTTTRERRQTRSTNVIQFESHVRGVARKLFLQAQSHNANDKGWYAIRGMGGYATTGYTSKEFLDAVRCMIMQATGLYGHRCKLTLTKDAKLHLQLWPLR